LPAKKVGQQRRTLCLADAAGDLGTVVEPPVAHHIPQRADGAGLGIPRAEHQPRDARQYECPGAHRAGLEGDRERAAVQVPRTECRTGAAQREHLGVPGRVVADFALVVRRGDHRAGRIEDDGSDRHLATGEGFARNRQRRRERSLIRPVHQPSSL